MVNRNKHRIINEEINRFLILEDRYTIPDNRRAISYMKKNGIDENEAKRIIDILMHDFGITNSKNPKMFFMVGLSRLYTNGELRDESSFRTINGLLPFMLKPDNFYQFQNSDNGHDFNGMSLSEISQAFGMQAKEENEKERNEIGSARYQSKGYDIVKIGTFEEASRYAKYTEWCITHGEGSFKGYNLSDVNQCYFCLKKGFESVPYPSDPKAAGAPFDEYGLSMISVIVDENGNPAHVTTRYNHDFDGEDNDGLKTAKQVSETVGVNFFETFKPSNKFKEAVEEATRRLANGEDPIDVFDSCGEFHVGYVQVKLNGKYNFIGKDEKYLSNQWFDRCSNFSEGYVAVKLNEKWNFIGTDGKYLSDRWFDYCGYFSEGYAKVKLNGKFNFIGKDGKYASEQWFDDCWDFSEGYVAVKLNEKWNFIGTDGKYLSNQWFDYCDSFREGYVAVKLNEKWNFIGTDGKYLSNQWFDRCGEFHEGYAAVRLNGKYNFIGTDGKLLSNQWFDWCLDFSEEYAAVRLNEKWNFIGTDGKYLSNQWFYSCNNFSEGCAAVKLNRKWNFVGKDGKYLSEQWFDWCWDFSEEYARVTLDGKEMKIDKQGNLHGMNESKYINMKNKRLIEKNETNKIISEEINRFLILEDRYTIPDNRRAIAYMKKNGIDENEAKRIIDILMHDFGITNSKNPKIFFMVGLSRLYIKGELRDESSFRTINGLLPFMLKPDNFYQFQNSDNGHDFNGMSLSEISQAFGMQAKEASEKERNEIGNARYQSKGYDIVKIDTFEEASRYAKYTKWCITHGEDAFKSYNLSDANQCYFCLKKGFENVPYPSDPSSDGAPFDEYGLSMISVIVDENGNPAHVTTRYNHDFDGEDNDGLKTAKQVSETVGVNFFETFKPSNKFKEAVEEATRRLANGEDPNEVFDSCWDFGEEYVQVKLNGKYNFIGKDEKYLSNQWFDRCSNFSEGYVAVKLNGKWNFIGTDGKYLSNQWFDSCSTFSEGYVQVKLNGKWNYIGNGGKYLSNQWFDWCWDFSEEYAAVRLNEKWNFIGTDGKYLSNQWFDSCDDFSEGYAAVKLNGKWLKIDKQGNLHGMNESKYINMKNKRLIEKNGTNKIINEEIDKIFLMERRSRGYKYRTKKERETYTKQDKPVDTETQSKFKRMYKNNLLNIRQVAKLLKPHLTTNGAQSELRKKMIGDLPLTSKEAEGIEKIADKI